MEMLLKEFFLQDGPTLMQEKERGSSPCLSSPCTTKGKEVEELGVKLILEKRDNVLILFYFILFLLFPQFESVFSCDKN